jgi:hypothetical protein
MYNIYPPYIVLEQGPYQAHSSVQRRLFSIPLRAEFANVNWVEEPLYFHSF